MSDRYVHTIWCDDIRQEVGNKPSFMGVYSDGIVLPSLPVVIPRLCVYSWIATPIEKPFHSLALKVIRDDGNVLVELPKIDNVDETIRVRREGAERIIVMAGINMGQVEIPESCKFLTVRVETDSETLEGSKLHIDINPKLFEKSNMSNSGNQ